MKIKTKLYLSFGFLLALVITLAVIGSSYIYTLKQDTKNILKDNYRSLEYAKNMLSALEQSDNGYLDIFERNLKAQEHNITESNENNLTKDLRSKFEKFKSDASDELVISELRTKLMSIISLNMEAIWRKNEVAQNTGDNAFVWISIASTLCFMIAITLFANLPSDIANPIKKLTESIKQIAAKNYSQMVYLGQHDEFWELAHSFNVMAQKLEEYNNSNLSQLLFEKKRIETLINNMSDPVLGLAENQTLIFINQAALKIINIDEKDCLNRPIKELSLKNDLMHTILEDIESGTSTENTKAQMLKIFTDNKELYFEKEILHISITPTGEKEACLAGHVIILRNVTEYKEIDSAKTNFIATVSHELKTPISSIKMSLQLLGNTHIGSLNNEQTQLLSSIEEDTARLLKTTGEMLNITQIESGNIQLSIMPVDVNHIIDYATNTLKTQADNKQIKFKISCPEFLPKVLADNEKTAWVLTNLVSNAVRYSHDGSTIYITAREKDNKVLVSVKDTGIGISPEYTGKIFDRYFRVPGTKIEGNGLGLSISKEFIEAQGGQILLESEIGVGSVFTIVLNLIGKNNKNTFMKM